MVKYINMFILLLIIAYSSSAQDRQTPTLVSPAWLSEHLNDPNLILIQVCRFRQEYTKAHIPSARFLWFEYISPNNPDESVGLPSVEQAKNTLQELGVSNDSHIILYSGPKVIAYVMRTFLILEYLGLASNVSIVNGGLDAWKAAGKPLSQEITHVTKCGNLTLKPNPHIIVNADWLKENLKNYSVQIVDSRAKNVFDGTPGSTVRTGHIIGAKNIPSSSVLDSLNRFKNVDELQKLFTDAGIVPSSKIVAYCNVGLSASILHLAAKLSGFESAVYDGSWEDWSERGDDYPVEVTPPAPDTSKSSGK